MGCFCHEWGSLVWVWDVMALEGVFNTSLFSFGFFSHMSWSTASFLWRKPEMNAGNGGEILRTIIVMQETRTMMGGGGVKGRERDTFCFFCPLSLRDRKIASPTTSAGGFRQELQHYFTFPLEF